MNNISIPEEMQEARRWILRGIDKRPINPATGKSSGWNNEQDFMTYKDVLQAQDEYRAPGLSFVTGGGWTGIDLDHVIQDRGVAAAAQSIVDEMDCYAELSPSGTGIHIFCRVDPEKIIVDERNPGIIHLNGKGAADHPEAQIIISDVTDDAEGKEAHIEIYHGRQSLTITGRPFGEVKPILDRTDKVLEMCGRFFPKREQIRPAHSSSIPYCSPTDDHDMALDALNHIPVNGIATDKWMEIGRAAKAAGISYDEFDLWCSADTGRGENGKPRYNARGNRSWWNGWDDPGPAARTKPATLYKHAQDAGWINPCSGAAFFQTEAGKMVAAAREAESKHHKKASEASESAAAVEAADSPTAAPERVSEPQNAPEGHPADRQPAVDAFAIYPASSYMMDGFDADVKKFREGGMSTGFKRWDKITTGLHSGLFMVASAPGNGKTTLCWQICENLAAGGSDVLFFSMEQSSMEFASKSISRRIKLDDMNTRITNSFVKAGAPSAQKAVDKAKASFVREVGDRLCIIPGNFSFSAKDIGRHVEAYMKRTGRRPVVCVDYLQALRPLPDSSRKGIREATGDTADCLCELKNKYDLCMIVISSVSRQSYYVPLEMDSLKESGDLEFDADAIWTLEYNCMSDDLFYSDTKVQEKKKVIDKEKAKPIRSMRLRCVKSRFSPAGSKSKLYYHTANDLFTEDDGSGFEPVSGADDVPFDLFEDIAQTVGA